jgi:2-polyprenyl-6-methoxyphenol hydroxylase-like FAD-dependent oxidoreductase
VAAQVLSRHFDRVVLTDPDLPEEVATRKGAQQVRHAHVLLARGASILGDLFPGLFDELSTLGGTRLDMSGANNWFHFGTWKRRFSGGVEVHFQSRVLLEETLRRRVLALPQVEVAPEMVRDVDWLGGLPRVRLNGEWTPCDLLVDASGRGSKMPGWLEDARYPRPSETAIPVRVTYTSASFRPDQAPDWGGILVYPTPPNEKRAGGALPIEGGEQLVSLFGWCGEQAQPNDVSYLEFAHSLSSGELAEFLSRAKRTSDYSVYHFKEARIRHYELIERFPPRTLVLGDALCSLDPVFGQGMTIAALAVETLAKLMDKCGGNLDQLSLEFRRAVPSSYADAWQLSTTEDFRFPEVAGERPTGTAFAHWYTRHVHRLTSVDENVARRFAKVMNLLEPPSHLMHPSVMKSVLSNALFPVPSRLARPTALEAPLGKATGG